MILKVLGNLVIIFISDLRISKWQMSNFNLVKLAASVCLHWSIKKVKNILSLILKGI